MSRQSPPRRPGEGPQPPGPRPTDGRLEQLIDQFEDEWQRGERPAIDDYLIAGTDLPRPPLLIELVHIDLERRLKAREAVAVEDYLARYPDLADVPGAVPTLAVREYELRLRREPSLDPGEYLRRFPRHQAE